ncbi:MAG: HRDC domain-containing protein [Verrucomicrobia bacterium]|nr:HRDC domain-containing protein [Verrucomicrobiota bacterium]MCF7709246.1 HRDC domain-containing protein [Verrucomicrobiota bacterium]
MIDNEKQLRQLLDSIPSADAVSMDTEADSLHAYPEKICLIQLSINNTDYLVDPLSNLNLEPLVQSISNKPLILHGADYDLRLLYRAFKFKPIDVFDTMLAARFLGIERFGLADLAHQLLGIDFEKGLQKANWGKRPLSNQMKAYARKDTHFLKPLADRLTGELKRKGRLEWHREFCERLVLDCCRETDSNNNNAWRLPKSDMLSPPALAVLKELWYWRENEAIMSNTPPFFILPHNTLVSLADAASKHSEIDKLIPSRISKRRRSELLDAVHRGIAVPEDEYPEILRKKRYRNTRAQNQFLKELLKRRNEQAMRLRIEPSFIAGKPLLISIAQDNQRAEKLMHWQRALLNL